MQLGYLSQAPDVTVTDIGTTTSFVDASGAPLTSTSSTDTSALDTASTDAVSKSTDVFGNIDLSKLVDSIAKGYVAVQTAINAGTAPRTTAATPRPGTVQQLPGGATRVVNADGSTTITDAAGNKQTITRSGQVVAGGAPLIDGIPNGTLLLAGIAVAGILLRRRG
jgi:hypothetical protein